MLLAYDTASIFLLKGLWIGQGPIGPQLGLSTRMRKEIVLRKNLRLKRSINTINDKWLVRGEEFKRLIANGKKQESLGI